METSAAPQPNATPTPEEFGIGQLFWDVHEAIIVAETATGRIALWNPAAAQLFGYSEAEALTLTVDVLVPPSLKQAHNEGISRYHHTGQGRLVGAGEAARVPALAKSGDTLMVELSLTRLRSPRVANSYVLAVVRDVTAKVRAEEQVQHSEARFRALMRQASDLVVILDAEGLTRYASAAIETISGLSSEEIAGQPLFSVLAAEHDDEIRRRVVNVPAGASAPPFDLRVRHRDGSWRDIEIIATNLLDDPDVEGIVINARDVTDRRRFEQQLLHLASHDPLTGLYNRRRFTDGLERELAQQPRTDACGAVLFIDLDGFKLINDRFGHQVGDDLLIGVAQGARAVLRDSDILGRLGGDEFAVLLTQATRAQAQRIAARLLEAIRRHLIAVAGETARVTASIGIALYPEHGTNAEALLNAADTAMYQAKEQRDFICTHDPRQRASARLREQSRWEARLRQAIAEDRLVLYAQPIRGLQSDTEQFELLLRLRDLDGELVLPGVFLPIAERSDLIREIDRWVVSHAIALLARCREAGRDIGLEVNLSGKSLADPLLLTLIESELERTEVDPTRLVLEITETAAIADFAAAQHFIATLKGHGCRFAIDDFGVGFASFAYLKRLPVDYLKIDGSFTRNLAQDAVDQHLVKAMVEVARGLGKQTIAEFVGDDATVGLLRGYGVDFGQGYHLGRPAPLEELVPGLAIESNAAAPRLWQQAS